MELGVKTSGVGVPTKIKDSGRGFFLSVKHQLIRTSADLYHYLNAVLVLLLSLCLMIVDVATPRFSLCCFNLSLSTSSLPRSLLFIQNSGT
ncbi:hypothetical protein SLEP1_g47682 [Rubroshorea leprosula]|uniref:Transmembrane protein n=1 Tax=Rubroshorea leprosula TaxID=152421 RepID=A0AAV5LRA5_9ROSI|nr:hypothetical protein SLEP1_g47682 [Rubroshorea leprosula]